MSDLGFWFLLFILSGALAAGCGGYRLFWSRRYEPPARHRWLRLRGEIVGPGAPSNVLHCATASGRELFSRTIELRDDRGRHGVIAGGAVLSGPLHRHPRLGLLRVLSVGDRVTLDGVPTAQARPESHYREASSSESIEAIRIAPGTWPELRWLRVPIAIAAVLCLTSAVALLFAPSPRACDCETRMAPPILAPPGAEPGLPTLQGAHVGDIHSSPAVDLRGNPR